jgi:hypothetical protein
MFVIDGLNGAFENDTRDVMSEALRYCTKA